MESEMTESSDFDPSRKAHLMLRRGLVLAEAEAITDETIAFCVDTGIQEIAWLTDAEAFNHGITPLDIVHQYVEVLHDVQDRCLGAGLIYSLNPWITLKWDDFGRDQRTVHNDFDWRVDIEGKQSNGSACLRSEAWRRYLCEAYRLYASTHPAILWLEDDFKTFMSGGGCFCQACLHAFSQQVGDQLDRAALVQRIFAPGKPDPIRAAWIDFLGAEMVETCRRLERAVHSEHAATRLGIMGSWSTDGRWWQEATQVLAGDTAPVSRPSLAPYVEGRATEFIPDAFDIVKEMKAFGPGVEHCPELENSTYTPFSKSMRMTRLQMLLSQLLGNRSITMNLFDTVGTPMDGDPRVGKMLKKTRPCLDALASACGQGGTAKGVRIPWEPRAADHIHLHDGESLPALAGAGEGWAGALQGSGMPVTWDDAPVAAATGRIVQALEHDALLTLLGGGLLLDGSAAAALDDMGYSRYLGVKVAGCHHRYDKALSAEEIVNDASGASPGTFIDFRRYNQKNMFYALEPSKGSRVVSRYVNPDREPRFPATVLFQNELGGRVAVHAFDLSEPPSPSFMTWTRKHQLCAITRWLGRGRVDLVVEGGAWMVPLRRDYEDYVFVGILNCETDAWDSMQLTLAWPFEVMPCRVSLTDDSRGWHPIEPAMSIEEGHLIVAIDRQLAALDFLAVAFFLR